MKEISSFRPSLQAEYSGRSSRRVSGDISALKTKLTLSKSLEGSKSFEGSLQRTQSASAAPQSVASQSVASQSVTSQSGASRQSQIGTSGRSTSNANILALLGANKLASRQLSAVDGVGRTPPSTPRETPPSSDPGSTPNPAPVSPKFSAQQKSWLDSNTGTYANLLVNNLSRTQPYSIDKVDIKWFSGNNSKPELISRAVGNLNEAGGKQLAQLLGGTLVDSPLETFGSQQRDQYIKMPNGQMIEASVLASQLNAARGATDPFAATQGVLEVYKFQNQSFDLASSTNAIDLVMKGKLQSAVAGSRPT